ncbi:uncharacterized protein BDV17DRAFT_251310 [Aspergillus undulatus]|uniref:uncharacterized protein n=1 Tax=Aspergillus undulatus TaxID=1810928 RepID=UPI003CCDF9B5
MSCKGDLRPFQRPVIRPYPSPDEAGYLRKLPEVIESNAVANPNHVFCLQAKQNPDRPFPSLISVTNSQLRDAISRCAGWIQFSVLPQLPNVADGSVNKGVPIALLMESDIGLSLPQMSFLGLDVPALLLSPRISTSIRSLLRRTSATAVIAPIRLEATAREAAQDTIPIHLPLSFESLLSSQDLNHRIPSAIHTTILTSPIAVC